MEELLAFPVTLVLIIVTCVFTLIAWSDQSVEDRFIFHVGAIKERKEYVRLLTSGLMHGGPMHLFFNMYVLWGFGRPIEQLLGPVGYLFVYIVALIGGSLWSLLENHRNPMYRALGASGAVSGIVIAFCMFAPFATLSFFFVLNMPAIVFAFLYIVISAYLSSQDGNLGNIGHDAHLGGAIAGGVATVLVDFRAWTSLIQSLSSIFGG